MRTDRAPNIREELVEARQIIEEIEVIIDLQDSEEEETETGEATTREAEVDTRLQTFVFGAGKKVIVSSIVPNCVRNARIRTRAIFAQNQATRWRIAIRRNMYAPFKQ